MADFETQSTNFLNWFTSIPGATLHPSLKLVDLRSRNAGRGIIATAPIEPETELFVVPRKSIISVENSSLSSKLPQIFTTLKDQASINDINEDEIVLPDPWLDLILVMIYEYLQGPASPWKPYFDIIPSNFDTLMFWTESELSELQASAVGSKIGRSSADEMFATKVLPVINQHSSIFYPANTPHLSDNELMTLAHRVGSAIMAYAFDLEKDSDENDSGDEEDGWAVDKEGTTSMGMVPVADMLNADATFNAHLNHGESALTMTSLRPIAAGEEVLNYYGPLPNSDLLRRYGYTSANHARYDVVEMPWETVLDAIRGLFAGKQLGAPEEEEVEDGFVLERDSGEPDETGQNNHAANFVGFPEELEVQVYQVIAPAVGIDVSKGRADKAQKARLRTAFLEVMARAIQIRQGQYSTSVDQDDEMLRNAAVQGRLRMAVEIRVGEKHLLQEALAHVNESLEKSRESYEESSDRPAKKQRTR